MILLKSMCFLHPVIYYRTCWSLLKKKNHFGQSTWNKVYVQFLACVQSACVQSLDLYICSLLAFLCLVRHGSIWVPHQNILMQENQVWSQDYIICYGILGASGTSMNRIHVIMMPLHKFSFFFGCRLAWKLELLLVKKWGSSVQVQPLWSSDLACFFLIDSCCHLRDVDVCLSVDSRLSTITANSKICGKPSGDYDVCK